MAASSKSSAEVEGKTGDQANQPLSFAFPKRRFEEKRPVYDYSLYSMTEQLKEVTDFYQADFNKSELATQLQLLSCIDINCSKQSITFKDIHKHFQSLPASQLSFMSQVTRLIKFILLMAATNAVSEWSASATRKIKTYLRWPRL